MKASRMATLSRLATEMNFGDFVLRVQNDLPVVSITVHRGFDNAGFVSPSSGRTVA